MTAPLCLLTRPLADIEALAARLKLQLDPAGQLGRGNLFSEKLLDELVQKGGA